MGGKAQQRVAGNAKPTNSGRIRELLINKHGAGNIITFSALSNSERPESFAPQSKVTPEKIEENPQQVATNSLNNKPTLVVKRIGDRDFFTRVRVPVDESSPKAKTSPIEETLKSPKQKTSAPTEILKDGVILLKTADSQELSSTEINNLQISPETSDNKRSESEAEDDQDFDQLLDHLAQIQVSRSLDRFNTLDDLDNEDFVIEEKLINLLNKCIKTFKEDLSIEEWDLINTSIYRWTELILQSDQFSQSLSKTNFCVKVFNFIFQLISLAKILKTEKNLEETFPMAISLLDDWDNFCSSKTYKGLVTLYFKLASKQTFDTKETEVLQALASLIIDTDPALILADSLLSEYLNTKPEFDSDLKLPENCRFCHLDENRFKNAPAICNLLKTNNRNVIIVAHSMLSAVMQQICESAETSTILPEQDELSDLILVPPMALMALLTSRDSIMSALLSDYKVGDISVTIEPDSDAYSCTLAYLLTWDLVIKFIVNIDKEAGQFMIHSLKKLGLIQRFLDYVFMLLPPLGERDSLNIRFGTGSDDPRSQHTSLSTYLKSPLRSSLNRSINEIELTALHVYFSVASHMPVTVRKWYNNNSNKRLCNLVNEYTTKHISSVICSQEMESVQEKCQERADSDKLNNLSIKARPSAKEVYAIYTRDEFKMELTIKLPSNYPLGSVQIDGGKRVGVTDVKWRSWLLQLTTFLAHQNGPILDGIDLWRRNIDKRFEGIDKCMICFSILHSNYQLPKKKCRTCTKMFHNMCLYKWFEASGNSTCPLCRNIW